MNMAGRVRVTASLQGGVVHKIQLTLKGIPDPVVLLG